LRTSCTRQPAGLHNFRMSTISEKAEGRIRLYEIRYRNVRTNADEPSGFTPVEHRTACVLMSKIPPCDGVRVYLKEVAKG